MSDERSSGPSPADDDADDALEPGGGPQRVVSEESVDDILESLDSQSAPDSSDGNAGSSDTDAATGEPVTTEFDEDDVPAPDAGTDGGDEQSTAETDTDSTDSAAVESTPESGEDGTTDSTSNESAEPEPASIDDAAASIPDDADLEDLAARVEAGDVTGADVRAAEAGEGRESTPEIDDVDLSMDDLETAAAPGSADDDWPDDAGPLAGSVDRDGGGSDDASDDSPGLLGRLKRFFSP